MSLALLSKFKKAQTTPEGLLIVLIEIILFMAFHPIIKTAIGTIENNSDDAMLIMVVNLYPIMFALVILITLLIYTSVRR